eukprot:3312374-Pleurochrysis_carterae.AAC.1
MLPHGAHVVLKLTRTSVPTLDSQNLRHSAKATYSPLRRWERVATGWPHLYIIVDPHTNILPDRYWRDAATNIV